MLNMGSMVWRLLSPVLSFLMFLMESILGLFVFLVVFSVLFFFIRYRFNPLKLDIEKLRTPYIKFKYYDLFRWLLVDFLDRKKHKGEFMEYGFTFYVGRQGAGKTLSMVRYLEIMKEKYPKCLIVTNFGYYRSDRFMADWHDLLTIRNGTDGVIFAIDEIHSEYSSKDWNNIPESLLSEISQQRKQRVKIVATSQFYSRIAKPLREQASTVVSCSTSFGRLTKNREYDALQYAMYVDNPISIKKKIRPLKKLSFVQSDGLRSCYDTYEKIERMKRIEFSPRMERGGN